MQSRAPLWVPLEKVRKITWPIFMWFPNQLRLARGHVGLPGYGFRVVRMKI
jgi:hypothetical protein